MNQPLIPTWDDFVPKHWFTKREGSSLWVTCFRMIGETEDDFSASAETIEFNEVRATALFGRPFYLDTSTAKVHFPTRHTAEVDSSQVRQVQAPPGAYLLLYTPFEVDGSPGDETACRRRIDEVAGLLGVF